MRYIRLTFIVALLSICSLASDLTDEQARQRAVSAIKDGAKWTSSGSLYVRRREEFENKIFEDQATVNGHISKAIYVFEVSEAGCEPTPGGQRAVAWSSTQILAGTLLSPAQLGMPIACQASKIRMRSLTGW